MSKGSAASQAEPAAAGSGRPLFSHEIRSDGRVIATLEAHQTADGVSVDSHIFPITEEVGGTGFTRPFPFASLEHARRFVDEALVAFEYLNCTVS